MKSKRYVYAVTVAFENCYGSILLHRKRKINSADDFKTVEEFIRTENKLNNAVIISIMPLGKERR